jgi:hypothetical protein
MNEMLRELEEDIRREKLQKLWNSFGRLMIGVSVGIILMTIGFVAWREHKQDVASEQTSRFIHALDRFNAGDYDGALALFGELADDDSPHYGLAMLRKAQLKVLTGHKDEAIKTYAVLATHDGSEANQPFIDLAKVLSAHDPKTLVEPDKASAFFYTQSEWKAWQLLQQGKKQEAAELFLSLRGDSAAPSSMRDRATLVLQQAGVAMNDEPAKDEKK